MVGAYKNEYRKEFKNDVEIFHYSDKTGEYKKLTINKAYDRDSWFFKIVNGKKGEDNKELTLALDRKELAYLIKELERAYNK